MAKSFKEWFKDKYGPDAYQLYRDMNKDRKDPKSPSRFLLEDELWNKDMSKIQQKKNKKWMA